MSSTHQYASNISHDEINNLPLGAFDGKVVLVSEANQLEKVFEEINIHRAVGFDTETRPVFVRGQQHKVALMQIALPNKVFILRLRHIGMAHEIIEFMQNERVLKVGIALRDDVKALQRLKRFKPEGIFELTELSKKAAIEVEGLKKLTAILLGFRISKSAQTSNWEAEQLTDKQILYAATDAWVCLEMYRKLKSFLPQH